MIPEPIFNSYLKKISWKKIYEREYGVQYSQAAVGLLATATYHFPKTSITQVIIPSTGNNTAFYIDGKSWVELVEGLNNAYTNRVEDLEQYEKQFLFDGENYVKTARRISKTNLQKLTNQELLELFLEHDEKKCRYSVFAWSAFILNNYVSDKATTILDTYITKFHKEDQKHEIYDSLFTPEKRAAILQLQYEVQTRRGKLSKKQLEDLYEQYKWLSCLDIHNKPWTKTEFKQQLKPFASNSTKQHTSFSKIIKGFDFSKKDLAYLLMAKRFVYIKDARDDFRREGVYYASSLFTEIAKRMDISLEDISYVQQQEIIQFLTSNQKTSPHLIQERKKGFVIYLDWRKQLVCLTGNEIPGALKLFNLLQQEKKSVELTGRVASKGNAKGTVTIVHGVKDLHKVKVGTILVAVTTHPDYVSAMRKAAAIVTDEGGITSHAAIVSREFGIPCIVGTKHATTLLKDGDLVRVDTIEGMIIKI